MCTWQQPSARATSTNASASHATYTVLHSARSPSKLDPAPFAALLPSIRLWPLLGVICCCISSPFILNHHYVLISWALPASSLLLSPVTTVYTSLLLPNVCLKLPQLLLQLLLLLLQLPLLRLQCCSLRLLQLLCHILLLLQSLNEAFCCCLTLRHCGRRASLQTKGSAAATLYTLLHAHAICGTHQLYRCHISGSRDAGLINPSCKLLKHLGLQAVHA